MAIAMLDLRLPSQPKGITAHHPYLQFHLEKMAVKMERETFWYRLTQVHLEKRERERERAMHVEHDIVLPIMSAGTVSK